MQGVMVLLSNGLAIDASVLGPIYVCQVYLITLTCDSQLRAPYEQSMRFSSSIVLSVICFFVHSCALVSIFISGRQSQIPLKDRL